MFDSISLLGSMPDLTVLQFSLVDNIFSMTVATMGAAALFFFLLAPVLELLSSCFNGFRNRRLDCLLPLFHDPP